MITLRIHHESEDKSTYPQTKYVNPNKFFPMECELRDPSLLHEEIIVNERQPSQMTDQHLERFTISTIANVRIPRNHMSIINIHVNDAYGNVAPSECLFELNGGVILPGVILLDGIANASSKVAILNLSSEEFCLPRDIPFASATKLEQDNYMELKSEDKESLLQPEMYTLMAISSITETAEVSEEEFTSEPDGLEESLEFDPTIANTEVIYNHARYKKLMKQLKPGTWNLSNKQRKKVEKVIYDNFTYTS